MRAGLPARINLLRLVTGAPACKRTTLARLSDAAARELVKKRDAWLNPPDASAAELKKRTLTNLYNENPTWLQDAHRELDHAVFAAYDWPNNLTDQEILTRLLQLNTERSRPPI